jgi:uridine kinase
MMAIRILLDHDVAEENITLLSLLMARTGVHSIAYAFPKVSICTTAVDESINERFWIVPGVGNFGDRCVGVDCVHGMHCTDTMARNIRRTCRTVTAR